MDFVVFYWFLWFLLGLWCAVKVHDKGHLSETMAFSKAGLKTPGWVKENLKTMKAGPL